MKAPFRADQVGSLLRPAQLIEARRRTAAGELDAAALAEVEDRAIERIIARQQAIGLRAVTDGELRRDNWMFDFLAGLQGTRVVLRPVAAGSSGETHAPIKATEVAGKLGFGGHPMLGHFRFLRQHSSVTAKMTIPSPTMLVTASRNWRDVVNRAAYTRIEDVYDDLARTYRNAIGAFYEAGCRYLQLDDVNMAYLCDASMRDKLRQRGDDPDVMLEQWVVMLNAAIADRPADMTITTHVCRGNFRSTWFAQGGYEVIAEALLARIDYD
ncbi:MAG TPA: 5-methyltetrahydropteroyltriglutamate--homocysteine S-methyltransferase, partial [Steroidobacteraceae bacterium]|nr:5-methyltetrahydropteroyltriglutamate--homocysteine S-methyltransferase [Steroidobacteraceae bacterium]